MRMETGPVCMCSTLGNSYNSHWALSHLWKAQSLWLNPTNPELWILWHFLYDTISFINQGPVILCADCFSIPWLI